VSTWSKELLRKIADADDLHISPFREDGVTYGTPTRARDYRRERGPVSVRREATSKSDSTKHGRFLKD